MGIDAVNPLAQEETKLIALVKKIKDLEIQLGESRALVQRLQDMINKYHDKAFSVKEVKNELP